MEPRGGGRTRVLRVTAFISEAHYGDPARLRRVLSSHGSDQPGPAHVVTGSGEQIEDLSFQLAAALPDPGASGGGVPVSTAVMAYIERRRRQELRRIVRGGVVMDVRPEGGGTARVTFGPRGHALADFARQRFVVFYQKTASNVAFAQLPAGAADHRDLRARFPELLVDADGARVAAVGPFPRVAALRELLREPPRPSASGEETCAICLERIDATRRDALACGHAFCSRCLARAFLVKPVCPTCGKVYGVLTGTQPRGGTMRHAAIDSPLPGWEGHGTIVIQYHIPSGIQQEEHPNPGEPYAGVRRRAFLPDCPEGRRVLALLAKAFEQRLVFTVGRSATSQRENAVTWNDVHHKTSMDGGPTNYGYPDPDYLRRVQEELAAKGIQ